MKSLNYLKRLWRKLTTPTAYQIWEEAWNKLQEEKRLHGISQRYWDIWYNEVCPAYRNLTKSTPKQHLSPLTNRILEDMDKPLSKRRYF